MTNSGILGAAIAIALAGPVGVVRAQEAEAVATEGGLEEVVVTAQKREEKHPGRADRGDRPDRRCAPAAGHRRPAQHVQLDPERPDQLVCELADSAVFTIRGVGVNDADPYVGTTVSVVVDGVVVGTNTAALISLFDIDRVEILRGPQGTLFGANTTGGVVNVVTKQPTGEFGGDAQLVYGDYDHIEANASLNFPITDNLAGKISVLKYMRDGYMTNTIDGDSSGDVDIMTVRPYLKYTGDSWDATLIGEYVRTRNDSQAGLNISPADRLLAVPGYTDSGHPVFFRGQSRDQPDQNDRDTYGATLTMDFETGLGDWVSITNYRKYDQDLYSDDDSTENVWLQTHRQIDHKQWSQELRDTVQFSDSLQWLIGAFGFHQEYFLDQDGKLDGFLPGLGQPQTQDQENESLSAFTQLYWDVTDRWRLQGGLRYTYEKTDARSTSTNTFNPSGHSSFDDPIDPAAVVVGEGSKSWDEDRLQAWRRFPRERRRDALRLLRAWLQVGWLHGAHHVPRGYRAPRSRNTSTRSSSASRATCSTAGCARTWLHFSTSTTTCRSRRTSRIPMAATAHASSTRQRPRPRDSSWS
jgi:iron complex outermembrane receptor protein